MDILLSPPLAFLIYIPLVLIIVGLGKALAGPSHANTMKSSIYGSGEEAAAGESSPGYRPFFMIAFFFAILHLGVLMMGSGNLSLTQGAYLLVLILSLIALILG